MRRRWSRSVVAVAALGLLTSTAYAQDAPPDTAELRQELDSREQQREAAEQRLGETRAAEGDARERLAEADRQLDTVLRDLDQVEADLVVATEARDRAVVEAERFRAQLAAIEAELAATEAQLNVSRDRFEARVAGAFKRGGSVTETTILGQLLAADDISEALSTAPFLTAVMDADRQLVDEVGVLLADVQDQRGEAARVRVSAEREAREAAAQADQVEAKLAEQRELTAAVAARRAEREAALEALREDRQAIESHLAGLDEESARITDQLAAIAREQAEQAARLAAEEAARRAAEEAAARERESSQGRGDDATPDTGSDASPDQGSGSSIAPPPGGSWTRPVGGGLTSPFGPRWGRNHNGIDLAGSVGTGVVAAQAGTVVGVTAACHPTSSFGCGGGFGNHVVVSHAAGMATIYAHLSAVSVGVGQEVGAGQVLGAVGNSGNSYGAHLHFEVREAGVPRNPCGFIGC